ncbi:leucine-rich repeat-containing protein 14-like, partial [Malurus melanocephalus]|uniref:leucine-rich repeat-containing protein 14-like n=1 Tax=Malurus melanocephalus TaxID=175006 RepID=UPI002548B584
PLVLRDLVAAWPFPVLNFQRLVGRRELLRDHPCKLCVQAVILAVVAQLRRDLEEPGRNSRWEFGNFGISIFAVILAVVAQLRRDLEEPGRSSSPRSDLQSPLESLELAFCSLLPADLAFLSQSSHAAALKRLDLSGHDFSRGLLEPLRLLLEETSASLLHLDLMECRMADSHLAALLPTLLRCCRLRFLGLYGNSLSTAALKELLRQTLPLPELRLVVYPFPADCYKPEPPRRVPGSRRIYEEPMDGERLAASSAEISRMLRESGRTDLVWTYNPYGHGALDYFSL